MDVEARLHALLDDAKIWDETSDVCGDAATMARGIDMNPGAVSLLGELTGFLSTYDDIQEFVAGLLDQGRDAAGRMARTLRSVHDQYERDEAGARQRIGAEWAPE